MKTLILIIVLTISLYSQNTWKIRLDLGGTPEESVIKKFEVIDSNNIYMISSTGTPNYLFKSTDNGKNWFLYKDLTEYNYPGAQEIEVVDSLMWIGFFGGSIQPEKGKMLKSTDYGKTFEKIEFPYKGEFRDIIMFDANNGIANMPLQICKTTDGWRTYDTIAFPYIHSSYRVRKLDSVNFISQYATFLNDKYELDDVFIQKYNILEDTYINLPTPASKKVFTQFYIYNDSTYYFAGKLNIIKGGSGHDVILKSIDAGKTWRTLLDLYADFSKLGISNCYPFGLQDINFKNDSVGIAVGQFGKILYTYDGGESWYYENRLPRLFDSLATPTMLITYAGERAIIGDFTGTIHTLEEDYLLFPQARDTLTISGKIHSEDSLAKSCTPIILYTGKGYKGIRVTMTDTEGNYKFTKVAPESYFVEALNKYYDGPDLNYSFYPYDYTPSYVLYELKSDTSSIDFNAENKRGSSMVTGTVSSKGKGLEGIEVLLSGDILRKDTTNSDGFFTFENIGKWINPYKLSPNNSNYSFAPEYYELYVNENIASQNFEASPITSVKATSKFQVRANVLYSEDIAGLEYYVYSLSGITLKSGALPKELDLNIFASGTYILNVRKGEEIIFTHKFQVVK